MCQGEFTQVLLRTRDSVVRSRVGLVQRGGNTAPPLPPQAGGAAPSASANASASAAVELSQPCGDALLARLMEEREDVRLNYRRGAKQPGSWVVAGWQLGSNWVGAGWLGAGHCSVQPACKGLRSVTRVVEFGRVRATGLTGCRRRAQRTSRSDPAEQIICRARAMRCPPPIYS
jgi:hypothetical protein